MPRPIPGSARLNRLSAYAFAAIQEKVAELEARGLRPVDFGVGDPTLPTPELVRRAHADRIESIVFAVAGFAAIVHAVAALIQ